MNRYWIQVFNRQILQGFSEGGLMKALTGVNFHSLCQQYGLDPGSIDPTLENLDLAASPERIAPFALLKYQVEGREPLVVYRWDVAEELGGSVLEKARTQAGQLEVQTHLAHTREIIAISLRQAQLKDMGLLLAYEVARWAADRGHGLVFGLDAIWYRLNRHQAFIPISEGSQV